MADGSGKHRVAVLGGGIAALTAAYQLSEDDRYAVTVYQMGWRLGGQGASGRNQDQAQRIEEHGLHIWFGFYENAFALMRRCYQALGRPPGAPLSSVETAFTPVDSLLIEEHLGGQALRWPISFPTNGLRPGEGADRPSLWGTLVLALKWMLELELQTPLTGGKPVPWGAPGPWWQRLLQAGLRAAEWARGLFGGGMPGFSQLPRWLQQLIGDLDARVDLAAERVGTWALRQLVAFVDALPLDPGDHHTEHHAAIRYLLGQFARHTWEHLEARVDTNPEARRLWIMLYLIATCVAGAIDDDVFGRGFDPLDEYELTEWLYAHRLLDNQRANDMAYRSEPMQTLYDLCFHYAEGDTARPAMAAGVGLRTLAEIFFGYKGSLYYTMNAAMGDTVFAPLYQVLRNRGVEFKFFHRVTGFEVDTTAKVVTGVRLSRQVNLKVGEYDPLLLVKDLPCWPSEPLYDQIVEGEELRAAARAYREAQQRAAMAEMRALGAMGSHPIPFPVSLEHSAGWTTWRDTGGEVTLRAGVDFDHVILGIGAGALPLICDELAAADSRWAAMLTNSHTVATQAMQIWLRPSEGQLGVPPGNRVTGGWIEPYSSLTNFGDLLLRENWPANDAPRDIVYACGVLADQHCTSQWDADTAAKQAALDLLRNEASPLWPRIANPAHPAGIDWEQLAATDDVEGEARFNAQYWRGNADPTERYVLTLPKTTKYRMKAGESGFANLILAGNWIDTGYNVACVETAVMSGMQAARVLTGEPFLIPGEQGI
ncbi:MAG: hypothetical protein OHK0015_55270 [Chloroflexi bacterium OHK40]